jgi:hypothetical protein
MLWMSHAWCRGLHQPPKRWKSREPQPTPATVKECLSRSPKRIWYSSVETALSFKSCFALLLIISASMYQKYPEVYQKLTFEIFMLISSQAMFCFILGFWTGGWWADDTLVVMWDTRNLLLLLPDFHLYKEMAVYPFTIDPTVWYKILLSSLFHKDKYVWCLHFIFCLFVCLFLQLSGKLLLRQFPSVHVNSLN